MSNAKRMLVGSPKKQKKAVSGINSKKPIIIGSISAVILLILIVGIFVDQLRPKYLLTLDGNKYTKEDLMYYIYNVENQYEQMDAIYQQLMGTGYWDQADSTGTTTNRYAALSNVMDLALQTELLYNKAIENSYTLTEEETADIKERVTTLLTETLSEKELKLTGFNEENLTQSLTKEVLANRFKEDTIDSFDINDEELKASVDYDTYRQYDVEYIYISTQKTDTEGNTVAMTVNEKNAAEEKITEFTKDIKDTEDWSTLISEDEKELLYNKKSFISGESGFTEEFETLLKSLNNGDVSGICTTDDGIYYVRMINNNSDETYNSKVEEAITNAENTQFETYFTDLLNETKYSINTNNLTTIRMGTVTIPR